jgi:hypothetical protein
MILVAVPTTSPSKEEAVTTPVTTTPPAVTIPMG